jgi:hypothetical protein
MVLDANVAHNKGWGVVYGPCVLMNNHAFETATRTHQCPPAHFTCVIHRSPWTRFLQRFAVHELALRRHFLVTNLAFIDWWGIGW